MAPNHSPPPKGAVAWLIQSPAASRLDLVNITLPGFRSRCTMSERCALSRASAISRPTFTTRSVGNGPLRIRWASVSPSRCSITRKSMPSCDPTSCSVQIFGWLSDEIAFASRSNRCFSSGLSDRCEVSTLMATVRSSRVSRAL